MRQQQTHGLVKVIAVPRAPFHEVLAESLFLEVCASAVLNLIKEGAEIAESIKSIAHDIRKGKEKEKVCRWHACVCVDL